jgi:hypothetical protein
MYQNSSCCDCNDYSLQTASVNIASVSTANAALTGAGATTIFTAGENGAIIKSIRIKAIVPVTTGMVRLFIGNSDGSQMSLYKEIPIPTSPVLDNTPIPTPVLPTFEMILQGGLKLLAGYKLYATTQNAQTFNIVTEGLNWAYPATLPDSCCNYKQEKASIGLGNIFVANTALNGTGNIVSVYAAPGSTNGSNVKCITIKALQPTSINGMVRIFISPDGVTYTLIHEIAVPQSEQSGHEPSFKYVLDMDMNINSGYIIGASTQLGETYALTVEATDWTYPIS